MSEQTSPIEIVSALICDDVRREANGKEIIIGVYGSAVYVPTIPSAIALAVWTRLRFLKAEEVRIEVRCIGDQDHQLLPTLKAIIALPPDVTEPATVVFGPAIINIQNPGNIVFQWRPENGQWNVLASIKVGKGGQEMVIPQGSVISAVTLPPHSPQPISSN